MINNEKKIQDDLSSSKLQNIWYFATNHLNLMYILSAGLIMSPKGFGEKYYEDTLSMAPGWIPLFSGNRNISNNVIDRVIKERNTLKPVIVAVNLSSLKGSGRAVTISNNLKDIQLPEELTDTYSMIFIPAPLPTAFIESLHFLSNDDKKVCEQDAKDYSNVPLGKFKRSVKKSIFGKPDQFEWALQEQFIDNHDISMDKFLAVGGMAAMMLNCGNMGDLAIAACNMSFDGTVQNSKFDLDNTIIQGLGDWRNTGTVSENRNFTNLLFWGIVDEIVKVGMESNTESTYHEAVLEYLMRIKETSDEKTQAALSQLINDLKALFQLSDKSITELFESHSREIRRALILFFLRDKCSELLELSNPLLKEADYLAAALLFAAREKWIGLPLSLRDYPRLDEAVSHRMAAMAHRVLKTGVEIGPSPPRCLPLRELLHQGTSDWNKKHNNAALTLSREMGWDCISTRVRLGRGAYSLSIDGGGVTLILPGEVKSVESEINRESFFTLMSENPFIDRKIESRVRKIFLK